MRWDPVEHLHARFATAPALVAMFTHQLSGVPYTFSAHARAIDVDTPPERLRAEMERAAAVVTVSEHNRESLLAGIQASSGLSTRTRWYQRVVALVSDVRSTA